MSKVCRKRSPGPKSKVERRGSVDSDRQGGSGWGARRPGPYVKAFDRRSRRPQRAKTGDFLYELCDLLLKSGPDTYGRAPEAGKHLTGGHVRNRDQKGGKFCHLMGPRSRVQSPRSGRDTGTQERPSPRPLPADWARVKERDGTRAVPGAGKSKVEDPEHRHPDFGLWTQNFGLTPRRDTSRGTGHNRIKSRPHPALSQRTGRGCKIGTGRGKHRTGQVAQRQNSPNLTCEAERLSEET
jgi:hypothetical protein